MRNTSLWMLALAGFAILALAVIRSGLESSRERIEAERWQDHTRAVQIETWRALSALQDAETGQRGFLITGDPDYLAPYESGRKAALASVDELSRLTAGDAEQQERLGALHEVAEAKLAELARTVALTRAGDIAGAQAFVKGGTGREYMDEVRALIGAISEREQINLARRRLALADASGDEKNFVFAMAALSLTALGGVAAAAIYAAKAEARAAIEKEELKRQALTRLAHAQRMEALGQLAGGVAHDFNNVLQAVQSAARVITRRPNDAEAVTKMAQVASDAAERGIGVTQRLLSFARRADLRTEAVDAQALFASLREILSHTLGGGVEVRIELAPDLPKFETDRAQLETVLVNLATNARDAMAGAGVLTFAAAPSLDPTQLKPGAYIHISVGDTGKGMSGEVLERAAEPFFTTKPQGLGTGLGLAMARGFSEQSGGGLTIESAVGRGTTVHLWLPIAQEKPSLEKLDSAESAAAASLAADKI